MLKYELIPQQLLYEGVLSTKQFFAPLAAKDEVIALTHSLDYLQRLRSLTISDKEMRKVGFPLSEQLVKREWMITGGTIQCTDYALQHGVAMNVAGGTHHAFYSHGEGFCLLNDFAVAANYLLQQHKAKRILIIDLDVHQGNGTAALFKNEPRVFTFSMHGKDNYPLHKEQSDLDIELPTGTTDAYYLECLKQNLQRLAISFNEDFIFYLSGVDVLAGDKLGKLALSLDACAQRDQLVFEFAKQRGTPIAVAMGGGYSPQVSTIVNAHCNTFKMAQKIFF